MSTSHPPEHYTNVVHEASVDGGWSGQLRIVVGNGISNEPLVFVEVALTRAVPANIHDVLDETREQIAADEATTAVFYSISNCQDGLRGISFGNFLIKQVVDDLKKELPGHRRPA